MFLKILKLLIRTRFTLSYFLTIFFLLLYSAIFLSDSTVGKVSLTGEAYFSFVITIFTTVSILFGGVSVTKSDQEFLLVSATRKRDLVPALFLSQFLASGLILLAAAMVSIFVVYRSSPLIYAAVADVVLLAVFSVASGIALSEKPLLLKVPIAAISIAWILSVYAGFRFSAIAFVAHNPLTALATILPAATVSFAGAAYVLSGSNLPYRVSGIRRQSRDFRRTSSFLNMSPRRAILKLGITQISIATRSSSLGNIRTTARRIQFSTFLYFFIAAAIVYFIMVIKFYKPSDYIIATPGFGFNLFTLLLVLYVGSAPQMMMSSGAMAYERAWLSFTSMEPGSYLNTVIVAKMMQSAIAGIPFSAVNIALYFYGVSGTLPAIPVFEIIGPFIVGIYLLMAFSIRPYQMKDENYLPARFSATQFLMVIPIFIFYGMASITMVYPPSLIYSVPIMALTMALILSRKKYWDARISKMVERGFI